MMVNCPYCTQDSAGNHEDNCPMAEPSLLVDKFVDFAKAPRPGQSEDYKKGVEHGFMMASNILSAAIIKGALKE